MKQNTQLVSDLAQMDTGLGTQGGEKADLVWETACDNLDVEVSELVQMVPVSESHVRTALKEMPPEAFGL
jgi:hypothetical protein